MSILITSPELRKNPPSGWKEEDKQEIRNVEEQIKYFNNLQSKKINDKSNALLIEIIKNLKRLLYKLKLNYKLNYKKITVDVYASVIADGNVLEGKFMCGLFVLGGFPQKIL